MRVSDVRESEALRPLGPSERPPQQRRSERRRKRDEASSEPGPDEAAQGTAPADSEDEAPDQAGSRHKLDSVA